MRQGRIRIELDAALELGFGCRPVPVEPQLDVPERDVRFAQRGIELHGLERGGLRFRDRFDPERTEEQIRVGEPGVGNGILRIFGNRLLQILDRLLVAVDRALVPVVAALEIQLVSFGIVGVPADHALPFFAGDANPQFVEYLGGDFFLHGEDVGHRPVVLPAP